MITTANARLAISVKATRNILTGGIELSSVVLPLEFCDAISIDSFGKTFMDIVHYANRSTHIKEKPIVDHTLQKLRETFQHRETYSVKIYKTIPTGYGLGSGASDAVAVVKAVSRLSKIPFTNIELTKIAEEIGNDMLYFTVNKPAIYYPTQHIVQPLTVTLKPYVLLLFHKTIVEKKEIIDDFNDFGEEHNQELSTVAKALEGASLRSLGKTLFNDLSESIIKKAPEMRVLLNELKTLNVEAFGIAGTGATVFAMSENKNLLKYIADKYRHLNYDVVITKILKQEK